MKKLVIGVASKAFIRQRTIDIAAGRIKPKDTDPKVWVNSMESVGRLLNADNLSMIETIRKQHPATISDLAKLMKREQSNVSRTLKRMVEFHIVEFEEAHGKKTPVVTWDELSIVPMSDAA
uniref:HVO_A0114 family putative DNA-binding protein n=1 Tax=Marinobacterium profundum TaxID=1714300 RepID=UPI00082A5A0F|nr:MarR family transcriptional regulator [Marinobacterium profundum]